MLTNIRERANLALVHGLFPSWNGAPLTHIGQGNGKRMRLRFELGWGMTSLRHLFDHPVNAQTQLFDVTPLEQPGHDARIAAEMFFDDVVYCDKSRQPARTDDFHSIREHADLDAPPAQAIVTVTHRIDQG